jgi:2'-5' RNA ligase
MDRLFAALPIPDELGFALERLVDPKLIGAHWLARDQYHVTLAFYGDVRPDKARDLSELLGEGLKRAPLIEVDGLGWYGKHEIYSLHARVKPAETLADLAKSCRRRARDLGLTADSRSFEPHITLARFGGACLQTIADWCQAQGRVSSDPFLVSRFDLFSSRPDKRGGHNYVSLAAYELV